MAASQRVEWFYQAKWGIFLHFLGRPKESAEHWNERIDNFDVSGLTKQLVELKAKYIIFTIGQISGHYCSPNATYDSIVKIEPSKCSRRDLIKDLYTELNKHDIKLMTYFPSDAPRYDKIATTRLKWKKPKNKWEKNPKKRDKIRMIKYQQNWESIIREYSLRWGNNVKGWWIDGCYYPKAMYEHNEPPNFESFANALRAGNPDSIIAFNPGVKVQIISHTKYEDYTAGEISKNLPECHKRWVNGKQYHILTYLGKWWGQGSARFSREFIKKYTKQINAQGGVISWDTGMNISGKILPELFEILKEIEN